MTTHIIYASITGNNKKIANYLFELLNNQEEKVKLAEIEFFNIKDLKENDTLIVVPYTYDFGSIPEEAIDFYNDLAKLDLSNISFFVIGSGDSYYKETFALAVEKFHQQLLNCHAKALHDPIKVDIFMSDDDKALLNKIFTK